ncbi:unnamed protein product [Hyaloperonospora brassicae]|uniref:RxLR effector candidate protein n=1 Tax=Hyaloperonospora brassicae TaxID=162125 RepID=A0AAV0UL38_HYABA|nr:unnamed protein product [Hyaloperonospora brassicae]
MTWQSVAVTTFIIVTAAAVADALGSTTDLRLHRPDPLQPLVDPRRQTTSQSPDAVANVRPPVSYAALVDTLSEARALFGRSAPSPSRMPLSPIDSSADVVVKVTPSASANASALLTDVASGASYALATPLSASSSVVRTYRNWVGPRHVQGDSACWREAHVVHDVCPSGFHRNNLTYTCWAECPLEFPIPCGFECIRQNDDCGREVFYKLGSLVNVGLNGIMDNWFGKFRAMSHAIRTATMCACMVLGEVRAILRYVRSIKAADPQTSRERLLTLLFQSNAVVVELPITIKLCMGGTATSKWWLADRILASTQYLLSQILAHGDYLVTSFDRFNAFLRGANFTVLPEMMTDGEIQYLKHALASNSTCGHDLQGLVERAWLTIEALREAHPNISNDELRVQVHNTELAQTDIARVTSNCMELLVQQSDERTAYATRDTLRKTFGVIFNDLITTGVSNNGSSYKASAYTYQWLNQGLNFWVSSGFDMSGISSMISEYFQSICGPTQFIGEVDDGTHPDTLGLNVIQKAFKNTTLSWTRRGDGHVVLTFTSHDIENVTVNIRSGGDKIDEVKVAAGKRATWQATVSTLGGKTLYLDRWRPGFLGLPGTGGGSLMLWIPHAAEGGHLDLNVQLNVS